MGLFDRFLHGPPASSEQLAQRDEAAFDAFVEALYDAIDERRRGFTLSQALKLPPIARGVRLLAGVGASMLPLVYRGGQALATQPRIVRKPDPFATRWTFVYQTIDALVSSEHGEAVWLLTGHERGYPTGAIVLDGAEVRIEWDERRFRPRVWWRSRELVPDVDCKIISPTRRAGQLRGVGPIYDALDYLYPIAMAEDFAASFFSSGGMPLTVLKTAATLDKAQAALLKQQWIDQRDASNGAAPAVASGGVEVDFPGADPEKAQMNQSRGAGATVAARILGIPGALLHVETSGATITYTNPEGALEELVKTTLAPLYLGPIEQAWSELVPAPQTVRFDLADMTRASIAARMAIYGQAIPLGIMEPAEARAFEGWGPLGQDTAHLFDPEPSEPAPAVSVPA